MNKSTRQAAIEELNAYVRPSSNGYEVMIALHYHTHTHYTWDAIRYPLDNPSIPSETLAEFNPPHTWEDAAMWARDYLARNPEDGFIATY